MFFNFIILTLILFFSLFASSKTIITDYKFLYGPSLSENEACEKAVVEAKKKAISKENETLSSETVMFCDEAATGELCKNYNAFWSSSNAIIKKFEIMERKVGKDKETNLNYCKISATAILSIAKGRSDPNFDFFSKLNKTLFFSGDKLNIFVETKTPMYLNIFQWQMNNDVFDANVVKIFPNQYDKKNFIKGKFYVPSNLNKEFTNYEFLVSFDEKNNDSDEKAEYILILATKSNINFRDTYLLGELKSIINEIDLNDRRERTHAYKIYNTKK